MCQVVNNDLETNAKIATAVFLWYEKRNTNMQIKINFIGVAVFVCAFFHISPAFAETPKILISEVQITGGTNHTDDDFIELYNPQSVSVDISRYRLRSKNSSGSEKSVNEIAPGTCIAALGYYLWANKDGVFAESADTKTGATLSANYSLALFVPESAGDTIIDSVSWGGGTHPFDPAVFSFSANPGANESIVRDVADDSWLPSFSTAPTPTKSTGTSCPAPAPDPTPDPTPQPTAPSAIRINEIFPNPKAKSDAGEFIELYNFGTEPADISGWTLRDATKTGKYVFPPGSIIAEAAYLAVTDQSFKLSLNNSSETLSLFDDKDALIDSVHYEKTKEDVSLNYTPAGWRGGAPTPGAANQPNTLPNTKEKVPKRGYRGVAVDFDARGSDADRDTLKHTWDFGDGHKSYKAKTSHIYEENGTYAVTLKTSDARDDVLETFSIKIVSYDHPAVRITALVPNPAGSDTDNEWLILENREKKSVNLKGFGIATGWKNLVNHPIREDFVIGGKKAAKLTRTDSLFTLPNQKGKIELRAPDGSVLQKIKYKLEQSAAEEAVYRKEKGSRWQWEEAGEQAAAVPEAESGDTENAAPLVLGATTDRVQENILTATTETIEPEAVGSMRNRQSFDPDRPDLRDLLSYGTHIRLPDTIALTPTPAQKTADLPEPTPYTITFTGALLSDINASINRLLDAAE